MPAIASISLLDGETTPVAHNFEPAKSNSDYAMFEDRVGGVYVGYGKLVLQLARPKGVSRVANRELVATARIEQPVLESLGTSDSGLTPPPTLAMRPWVEVSYHLPERMTRQQRKNLHTLMRQLHSSTAFLGMVEDYSIPW